MCDAWGSKLAGTCRHLLYCPSQACIGQACKTSGPTLAPHLLQIEGGTCSRCDDHIQQLHVDIHLQTALAALQRMAPAGTAAHGML